MIRPRCPACACEPIDLATDCNPFKRDDFIPSRDVTVSLSCANGHKWIEGVEWDREGRLISHRKMEYGGSEQ